MPNFFFKDALLRFNAGFLSARVGEWLYTVALNWLILVETSSPLLLAVINACRLLPTLVLSLPSGYLADRYDRRTLNILINLANAAVIVLTGLCLHYGLPFWACAALVILRAVLTAAEPPFRNTYLCNLFSGLKLKSAIAQNASIMNVGKIIGPVLGGFLLAHYGGLVTFLAAALTTALSSLVLLSMDRQGSEPSTVLRHSDAPEEKTLTLREHFAERPTLRNLVLLALPVMFFGFPYTAMLPVVTETMLGLGAEQFGALLSISSVGALLASTRLAYRPDLSTWKATLRFSLWFAVSVTLLAVVNGFLSAAVVLFAIGYLGQAYRSSSRMCFQDLVPKKDAGKLLGVALMDKGMIPLGGLAIGALAEYWDARMGLALMGLGCILGVLPFFRLTPRLPSALLAACLLGPFLVGCTASQPAEVQDSRASLEVQHVWGTSRVPLAPERVVVLDLPFLDAFSSLGYPVVGFAGTSDRQIPEYLVDRVPKDYTPVFVGERKQPNLEVILSLEPDLIVANPNRHKLIRSQLEQIAPTIALSDASFDEALKSLGILGRITDRVQDAEQTERELRAKIEEIRQNQQKQSPPTVMVVGAFEGEFSTWTKGSFIATLLQATGAAYAFDGPPTASESQTEVAKITVEGLSQLNPEYLFVYGNAERWSEHPLFQGLSALREDRIFVVDRDLWSRARGPIAAEIILKSYGEFLEERAGSSPESSALRVLQANSSTSERL